MIYENSLFYMWNINILIIQSDNGGCAKYRTLDPHKKIKELYPKEFNITFSHNWKRIDKYDIVQFHNGLYKNQEEFNDLLNYCKEHNIITVMDIDDYWELYPEHILYSTSIESNRANRIINNLKSVDYVTTTTEELAKRIRPYNENVVIFPNALDDSFYVEKKKSDKVRFGFVMGNTHELDLKEFENVTKLLPKEVLDKTEFVLCGYPQEIFLGYDFAGKILTKSEPYKEVWDAYESIINKNVNYKRLYRKDINHYNSFYSNIDVLLVPLASNEFNSCKSELKFIEAGFTKTAVICSDFGPYSIGPNCIRCKTKQDWANAITELTNNKELRKQLTEDILNYVHIHNNLDTISQKRAEWYKLIKYGI